MRKVEESAKVKRGKEVVEQLCRLPLQKGEKMIFFPLYFILFYFQIEQYFTSDAIFTFISDQLPQRCISLFEQRAVVCVSVKLQTTSGHIW